MTYWQVFQLVWEILADVIPIIINKLGNLSGSSNFVNLNGEIHQPRLAVLETRRKEITDEIAGLIIGWIDECHT